MKKALFIGLGTTGMNILATIRDRIQREVGSLEQVTFVKFLVLESDIQTTHQFPSSEFIPIGINLNGIDKIRNGQLDEELDITSGDWLHSLNIPQKALTGGAQGVRYQGRVCFFYPENLNKIYTSLTGVLSQLASLTTEQCKEKWGDDADWGLRDEIVNIYVVGTAGGGTYSGCMIDLGYLLRYIIEGQQIAERELTYNLLSFTCLPGVNPPGDADGKMKILGNSYGLLNDLMYYSEDINRYGFNYSFTGGRNSRERFWDNRSAGDKMPFDYNYLICCHRAGRDIDLDEVKNILSMYLYTDVFHDVELTDAERTEYPSAANLRDARRADMSQAFTQIDEDYGLYKCFLTFGLSQIEFSIDRVINACGAKLLDLAFQRISNNTFAGLTWDTINELTDLNEILDKLLSPMTGDVGIGLLEKLGLAHDQLAGDVGINILKKLGVAQSLLSDMSSDGESGSLIQHEPSFKLMVSSVLNRSGGFIDSLSEATRMIEAGFGTQNVKASVAKDYFITKMKENRGKVFKAFKVNLQSWIREALFDPKRGPDHILIGLTLLAKYASIISQSAQQSRTGDDTNAIRGVIQRHENNIRDYKRSASLGFLCAKDYAVNREKEKAREYVMKLFDRRLEYAVNNEIVSLFAAIRPYIEREAGDRDRQAWDLRKRIKVFRDYLLDRGNLALQETINELGQGNPIAVVKDLFNYTSVTAIDSPHSEFIQGLSAYGQGTFVGGSVTEIVDRAVQGFFDDLTHSPNATNNPIFDLNALIHELFNQPVDMSLFDATGSIRERYFDAEFSEGDIEHLFNSATKFFKYPNFKTTLSVLRKFAEKHIEKNAYETSVNEFINDSRYLIDMDVSGRFRTVKILIGPGFVDSQDADRKDVEKAKDFIRIAYEHDDGPKLDKDTFIRHNLSKSSIIYLRELGSWPLPELQLLDKYYWDGVKELERKQNLYYQANYFIDILPPRKKVQQQEVDRIKSDVFFAIQLEIIRIEAAPSERRYYEFKKKIFPQSLQSIVTSFIAESQLSKDGPNIYNTLRRDITDYIDNAPDEVYEKISDEGLVKHNQDPTTDQINKEKDKQLRVLGVMGSVFSRSQIYNHFRNVFINSYLPLKKAQERYNSKLADWFIKESRKDPGEHFFRKVGAITIKQACHTCLECGERLSGVDDESVSKLRKMIVDKTLTNCKKCGEYLFTLFKFS